MALSDLAYVQLKEMKEICLDAWKFMQDIRQKFQNLRDQIVNACDNKTPNNKTRATLTLPQLREEKRIYSMLLMKSLAFTTKLRKKIETIDKELVDRE